MSLISILIITYNRPEDTLALLEDLRDQNNATEYVGEILLLNNASTCSYEQIDDFLIKHPALPIKYIRHNQNLGVAGGRNFLIKQARYPLLLVLDDDVLFAEHDSLERISVLFDKPQYLEHNTAIITLNIFYFETGCRQKSALPHKQYDIYKDKEWFFTYYFTGAAHLMRKELFEQTGYYPEDFFYGMEEYDLSYRVIEAGYSLAYDNSVKVLHKESPTGRVSNREKLGMMWYNKCVVAWRYLPTKYFYSTLLMWLLQYLKMTRFYFPGLLKNIYKIKWIPKRITSQKIGSHSLLYLKKVNARLWY